MTVPVRFPSCSLERVISMGVTDGLLILVSDCPLMTSLKNSSLYPTWFITEISLPIGICPLYLPPYSTQMPHTYPQAFAIFVIHTESLAPAGILETQFAFCPVSLQFLGQNAPWSVSVVLRGVWTLVVENIFKLSVFNSCKNLIWHEHIFDNSRLNAGSIWLLC